MRKHWVLITITIAAVLAAAAYFRFFFVFGEGVKSEFEFSVENEALARELMLQGGKTLELHYKEYFGALPWRGFTKFVVDSIITVRPAEQGKQGVDR